MRKRILNILLDNKDNFMSGEEISQRVGISRTAVWKHIKAIKESGYEIESMTNKGYRIIVSPDKLTSEIVLKNIKSNIIGRKIIHFESIDSTNDYAKGIAREEEEGTVIISEEQTRGKGRTGRVWHSVKGDGIWMSIILKPSIFPYEAPFITQIVAASIATALQSLGVAAKIKWPNDIIINNKKVCGILTEMTGEIEKLEYIIVGIGINVNTVEFSPEIKNVATSIKKEGYDVSRADIVRSVLFEFEKLYLDFVNNKNKSETINICKRESLLIGKEVYVLRGEEKEKVRVIDINENGNLVVIDEMLDKKEIICGEVSIRGELGYV